MAEVASAAGEKWRSLSEEEKKGYEEASDKAKVLCMLRVWHRSHLSTAVSVMSVPLMICMLV